MNHEYYADKIISYITIVGCAFFGGCAIEAGNTLGEKIGYAFGGLAVSLGGVVLNELNEQGKVLYERVEQALSALEKKVKP